MENKPYDCIVVGAGPAGLSASIFLARYCYRVLTFHHNSPRNAYAHGVHGFLGHHGIPPAELLARGRDEVTDHGGSVVEACVTAIERVGKNFRVTVGDEESSRPGRTFESTRILLATGLRDSTPDLPGFREFYGFTVHHCPDCDGYESRDKRIAVLGSGSDTVGFTLNLLTWSDRVTLITDGEGISLADREKLSSLKIEVRDAEVTALEGDSESKQLQRVRFADGEPLECDALFFNLGSQPASNLHEMLGCKLDEECGLIWVDKTQQTSVEGVFAAGDITPRSQLAIVAAAEGAMAAIHIHQSLIPAERRT